jgi:DNA-binding PadR family transcriptional regulator
MTSTQANQPLTEATYFIILCLAQEPKHGYAIMKEVQRLSDNRVLLSTGTLYGVLKRLLAQGWIERIDEPEQDNQETGRPRKSYALTPMGRQVLRAELERLRGLIAAATPLIGTVDL